MPGEMNNDVLTQSDKNSSWYGNLQLLLMYKVEKQNEN